MPVWHFKSPEFNASRYKRMTLAHYCTLFSALTRAPHKPPLLLAVMDLVARGVITSRLISIFSFLAPAPGTVLETAPVARA